MMMLNDMLKKASCRMEAGVIAYHGTRPYTSCFCTVSLLNSDASFIRCCSLLIKVQVDIKPLGNQGFHITAAFKVLEGCMEEGALSLRFHFGAWSSENYFFMPGAVYNGNRFRSISLPYPPLIADKEAMSETVPITITDIPRLKAAQEDGASVIQLLAGDMSTPAAGFYSPQDHTGFFLLAGQQTVLGENGFFFEESPCKGKADLTLHAPGVREGCKYTLCNMSDALSDDRGARLEKGNEVSVPADIYLFKCPDMYAFYNKFIQIRQSFSSYPKRKNEIPFSAAWNLQQEVFNQERWENAQGYYCSFPPDLMEGVYEYQLGWVGGLMCTYALLQHGNCVSRERALRNIDTALSRTLSKSGFLYGAGTKGVFCGDAIWGEPWPYHLHSVRKSGDALYFLMKQVMLLESCKDVKDSNYKDWETPELWENAICKLVDAFVWLWREYGQFGQMADIETGRILVGGSTAGAIVPAGLALASRYFGNTVYLEVACASAQRFHDKDLYKGVTCGGPIEILQCPDSESAYALVETFVVLYETTGEDGWIRKAENAANQFASWCVSYDYTWPLGTEFGRLDMRTNGAVVANAQNKHAAPGICTFSGDALLKLYRMTGNKCYLELLRDIAHNLPQYLSRADRPITAWDGRMLPPGWMNERVNMSDWEGKDKIGGVFFGSCWCEVSNMLTYSEIPGIYVQPDTGFMCVFDHVEAEMTKCADGEMLLKITNPTGFDAQVKLFIENSFDMASILAQNWLTGCQKVEIKAGDISSIFIRSDRSINATSQQALF